MESTLKYLLYAMSAVAVITGGNVLFGGASAVPGALGGVEATVDNELRFFSVYWMAFGAFCYWVARQIKTRFTFVPAIAGVFFLGGVGRLISQLMVGTPSGVLVSAMILEFLLPIVLCLIYFKQYRAALPLANEG